MWTNIIALLARLLSFFVTPCGVPLDKIAISASKTPFTIAEIVQPLMTLVV